MKKTPSPGKSATISDNCSIIYGRVKDMGENGVCDKYAAVHKLLENM
jgi:hypothetical protein